MPTRNSSIRLSLDSGTFRSEVCRLTGQTSAEGERMGRLFTRPMQSGLENIKKSLKGITNFAKTALPGALMGAYQATKGLITEAQQLAKVGTIESRLERAMEFKKGLIIKGIEAGLKPEERAKAETSILEAAKKSGVDPVAMINSLVEAQSRFAKFKEFIPYLETLGKVSIATNSRLEDLTGMMGTSATIFGLKGKELEDSLYFMVDSAKSGSISIGEFSDSLAKFMGSFKGYAEVKGFKGLREMTGFFQAIQKTMQADAQEVGTYGRAFLADITKLETQRKLKKHRVLVTGEKGELLPIPELAEVLYKAKEAGKLPKKVEAEIFKNVRSMAAYRALIQTLESDRDYFRKVTGATAETGRQMVEEQYKGVMGGEMGKLQRIGVDAMVKAIEKLEPVAEVERALAEKVTGLQAEFPILSKAMGVLSTIIAGAGGTALLAWLLKGKTAVATAATAAESFVGPGAGTGLVEYTASELGAAATGVGTGLASLLLGLSGLVGVGAGYGTYKGIVEPEMQSRGEVSRMVDELIGTIKSQPIKEKSPLMIESALAEVRRLKKELEPNAISSMLNLAVGAFGGAGEEASLKTEYQERSRMKKLTETETMLIETLRKLNDGAGKAAGALKKVGETAPPTPGRGEPSRSSRGVRKPANSVPGSIGVEG